MGAFTLLGIPGLEQYHVWISVPFCLIYLVAIVGNSILLMAMEHSLHAPMFFFLSMLVITDLILSTTCVPKALSIFWFGPQRISFPGCLTQLFFLHFSFVLDSSILMAMRGTQNPYQILMEMLAQASRATPMCSQYV